MVSFRWLKLKNPLVHFYSSPVSTITRNTTNSRGKTLIRYLNCTVLASIYKLNRVNATRKCSSNLTKVNLRTLFRREHFEKKKNFVSQKNQSRLQTKNSGHRATRERKCLQFEVVLFSEPCRELSPIPKIF